MEPSEFNIALDAIERINRTDTVEQLQTQLRQSFSALGYEHSLFALAPNAQRSTFERLVVLQDWPRDWFEQYRESNFHSHDPIANHVRTQLDPFDWDEAPPTDDPVSKKLMAISAFDFKMQRGRCIPIHDFFGYRGAISLAGSNDSKRASGAADLIAMTAFNRVNGIQGRTRTARLTPREREVVTWAAAGKTAWDTGAILGISEKTVEKHMTAAMQKFDAHTKAQLVAECLRTGEIAL